MTGKAPSVSRKSVDPARALARRDPVLRALIRRVGPCGLRHDPAREPYEALVRAIAFQQLNTAVATKILGRFIDLFPGAGFPPPHRVIEAPEDALRGAGLSRNKIAAIRDIADKALGGVVPSRAEAMTLDDASLIERLVRIRGVGRWTVEMLLISTLGRPDVLPADDYGVRAGYKVAAGLDAVPRPKEMAEIGAAWAPHRTTAAWYLWRAVDLAKG